MAVTGLSTASDWGTFVEPLSGAAEIPDLAAHLGIRISSGHRASFKRWHGQNRLFDAIAQRIKSTRIECEDQCSEKHYVDLFELVRSHYGRIDRVVEVGVFMGGASTLLAGCIPPLDVSLDLVDPNAGFLRFTHERIRRTFPEAIGRVRLFRGDLPTYVHRVLLGEPCSALVHHDGSHDFTQVVKDLASLSFVRDKVRGVLLQDTHLRGKIQYCNFVDAAIYAVFGFDVQCVPMGTSYPAGSSQTEPNPWQGNYFLPDTAEGAYVSLETNAFRYPHPSMTLEEFLPASSPATTGKAA